MEPVVIKVDRTTRNRLRELGNKGESYDDVIRWLLEIGEERGRFGELLPEGEE